MYNWGRISDKEIGIYALYYQSLSAIKERRSKTISDWMGCKERSIKNKLSHSYKCGKGISDNTDIISAAGNYEIPVPNSHLCNYINSGEADAGNTEFDFAKMPDEDAEEARDGLVEEKGFFILPSELFCNVRANAANDENLNETLECVFRHIEESAKGSDAESDFAGLFDDYDVNSNKLGSTVAKRNEKLVKLLNGVGEMNLGDVKDHSIDAFGDAYEYLMTMYASNAGKSGGEFFTPADVSELLTWLGTVGKTEINKVYDPACGSGSLLLKAEKILGKDAIRNGFYGQELFPIPHILSNGQEMGIRC